MISAVSLLVAAALVSQHYGIEANSQIEDSKLTLANSLQPNVIEPIKRERRLKKYVRIWSAPAEELKRVASERVELECIAMGNPPPSVYWMKNGETIQNPAEEVNDIFPSPTMGIAQLTSKLIISSSTPGEDEYTCVAEAEGKRATATSTVFTIPSGDDEEELLALRKLILSTKPTITYVYNELFQESGSLAILPCRVHSLTPSKTIWQDKNERPIYGSSRLRVLSSGDLMISSLRWSDMGNFTCIAKNMYGKDSVNTFVYPVKP